MRQDKVCGWKSIRAYTCSIPRLHQPADTKEEVTAKGVIRVLDGLPTLDLREEKGECCKTAERY